MLPRTVQTKGVLLVNATTKPDVDEAVQVLVPLIAIVSGVQDRVIV